MSEPKNSAVWMWCTSTRLPSLRRCKHSSTTPTSATSRPSFCGASPMWAVPLGRVHLGKRRRNSGRVASGLHIHSAPIDDDELVLVDGLVLTSPARTVLDVACSVPFE